MNDKFEDLSPKLDNHISDVASLMHALLPFHSAREETYQLSFAKRGEAGVWMNLARKYDRIDLLASRVLSSDDGNNGVTLVDTLVDTAMYALKWLAVIGQLRPEELLKWIEDVYCRDTGMALDEALAQFASVGVDVAETCADYTSQFIGLEKLISHDYVDAVGHAYDSVTGLIRGGVPIHDSISSRVLQWREWYKSPSGDPPVDVDMLVRDIKQYAPNTADGLRGVACIIAYINAYMDTI